MIDTFTEDENSQLVKLCAKHEVVARLVDMVNELTSDPSKVLRKEISDTAICIAEEMKLIREGKKDECIILTGEDKLFEKITKILTDGGKIMDNMTAGKPESKAKKTNGKHVTTY